jgi:hypothetical protein
MLIIAVFLIFYDYNSTKAGIATLIILAYTYAARKFRPNDSNIISDAEFYSNVVQVYTFLTSVILSNYSYDVTAYIFLSFAAVFNAIFIIYMILKMIRNAYDTTMYTMI